MQDSAEFWSAGKAYYDPAKITVPTLLVHGEWDRDTPPYMAQTLFPLLVNSPGKRYVHAAGRHAHHHHGEEPAACCSRRCRRSSTSPDGRSTTAIEGAYDSRVMLRLLRLLDCGGAGAACRSRVADLPRAAPPRRRRDPHQRGSASDPVGCAQNGMVVAQETRAARVGVDILQQGGNAVDAAVATGFALAVTYPRAGNIGGGGYMVIHLADRNVQDRDRLSRDRAGRDDARRLPRRKRRGRPAEVARLRARVGVPGTVAGLALAHAKYGSGKFTLARPDRTGHPARARGHPESRTTSPIRCRARQPRLARWPASAKIFLQARRPPARHRRHPGAGRPRRHAGGDRRATGRGRSTTAPIAEQIAAARARRRRHDDARRPEELPARSSARRCAAAIAAMTSCRCRRPPPAA